MKNLMKILLVLSIFLPNIKTKAAQLNFCRNTVANNQSFTSTGTLSGIGGIFRMSIAQSGPFVIQNLQGGWNNRSIGGFQAIQGPNSRISYSGIIPGNAIPGQRVEITFFIHDLRNRLVFQGSTNLIAGGRSSGWEKVWPTNGSGGIIGYENLHPGDFDGDGAEEILGVENTWMTMFHYESDQWEWGWSNYADPLIGEGLYNYRNNLTVGDFDGDGYDDIFGVNGNLATMFHFNNGNWNSGWNNNGSQTQGNGIFYFLNNLLVGDFDGDGNDDLLGVVGDWITIFHYKDGDWQWGWSNFGYPSVGNGIFPYRNDLIVGDLNGDGRDEVIGLSGWGTVFSYTENYWEWGWSTYGSNSFGGWTYPLVETDKVLIANIDYTDNLEELIFIQGAHNGAWSTTMDFENNHPNWRWTNGANPPFIGDWPIFATASESKYLMVEAIAGEPALLLAQDSACGNRNMKMYRIEFPNQNY